MKFGIAGNLSKAELPQVAASLIERFERDGVAFVIQDTLAKLLQRSKTVKIPRSVTVSTQKLASSCDMLISLGGDGTILRMARLVGSKRVPILGINL
ncbi:MAG: NAD(+)/NADH kinase, partial [Bacteroidota bacterium]